MLVFLERFFGFCKNQDLPRCMRMTKEIIERSFFFNGDLECSIVSAEMFQVGFSISTWKERCSRRVDRETR